LSKSSPEFQEHVNGREIPVPRGKVLGGTSAINSMTWARPCKGDLDALEELWEEEDARISSSGRIVSKVERWDWDSWLPYYLKSETLHPPSTTASPPEHPKLDLKLYDPRFHPDTRNGGPMQLSYVPWVGVTHRPFFKTLESTLGMKPNPDNVRCHTPDPLYSLNSRTLQGSGSNIGSYTLPTSISPDGQRSYSASAYYASRGPKNNLVLFLNTRATKLIYSKTENSGTGGMWSGRSGATTRGSAVVVRGVEVLRGGWSGALSPGHGSGNHIEVIRVKNGGEVILSAG
jgi:choline dehydrogenase-like flavoprotein